MREPRLSRRTTLGSALAAPLVLAACDIDPPRADPTSSATPEPPEDAELVSDVVAAIVIAQGVLDAAVRSVPDLASRLDPLRAAHAEHLDVLIGAVPEADLPTGALATVSPRAAVALRRRRRAAAVARAMRRALLPAP